MVRTLADPGLDDGDRKLISDVTEYGFHIVQVGAHATGNEAELAGWAFTVGLTHRFEHPELTLFGLPEGVSATVLGDLGRRVIAGERFDTGSQLADVIEGYSLAFRHVRPRWFTPFLGYAQWFYRGDKFPALQVFWPDREKQFPWDREAPDHDSILQPLLYEKSSTDARTVPFLRMLHLAIEEEDSV